MLPHLRSRWLVPLCAISLAAVTLGCDDLLTEAPPAGDDFETRVNVGGRMVHTRFP